MLLFIQLGNVIYVGSGARTNTVDRTSGEELNLTTYIDAYGYSKESNIIMLILDAYQTDVFAELLSESREMVEELEGFTYYPDALGAYPYTALSIPFLLTGRFYLNEAPRFGFLEENYREHGIFSALKDFGYHVGVHPYNKDTRTEYLRATAGIAPSTQSEKDSFNKRVVANEITRLCSVSLFRISPHVSKHLIHTRFLLDTGKKQDRDHFINDIKSYSAVAQEEPVFRLYHLQGLHMPWVIDGTLIERNRENARAVGRLLNTLIIEFVRELKRIDSYNNASIFIIADHGIGGFPFEHGEFPCEEPSMDGALDDFANKDKALPLVLFKGAKAHGPFQISMLPVSLVDVAPTILDIAGLELLSDQEGISLISDTIDPARIRRYFSYDFHAPRKDGYWQPLHEYQISGFSWCDSSWNRTGSIFAPE